MKLAINPYLNTPHPSSTTSIVYICLPSKCRIFIIHPLLSLSPRAGNKFYYAMILFVDLSYGTNISTYQKRKDKLILLQSLFLRMYKQLLNYPQSNSGCEGQIKFTELDLFLSSNAKGIYSVGYIRK